MANAIAQTATVTAVNHSLVSPVAKSRPPPTSVNFNATRNRCSSDASVCAQPSSSRVTRRAVGWGLLGAVLGLSVRHESALAAKRGPPPAPTEEKEKKDPNVGGALAKVLASRKRKEAMKEAMAKQRERGKPIDKTPADKPAQEDEPVEKKPDE